MDKNIIVFADGEHIFDCIKHFRDLMHFSAWDTDIRIKLTNDENIIIIDNNNNIHRIRTSQFNYIQIKTRPI